jgi:hypothetical protein
MLRDFARRCEQWAQVLEDGNGATDDVVNILTSQTGLTVERLKPWLEREEEIREALLNVDVPAVSPSSLPTTSSPFVTADTLQVPTTSPSTATARAPVSLPWRRGDYFFCEGCTQRRQWWKDSPPWRGAICATCYNAELARIEVARGRKA